MDFVQAVACADPEAPIACYCQRSDVIVTEAKRLFFCGPAVKGLAFNSAQAILCPEPDKAQLVLDHGRDGVLTQSVFDRVIGKAVTTLRADIAAKECKDDEQSCTEKHGPIYGEQLVPLRCKLEFRSMKKRIVVLSGAGMSAESGIPTFRGAGGLWEGHSVESVATPEAWRHDPSLVTRFYNMRRKKLMEVEPNEGHRLLASLEDLFDIHIITQNIDNLHERAGSSRVLHLHGELMKVQSSVDPAWVKELDHWEVKATDLCPNGYPVRPHVVWFGEAVPMIEPAAALMQTADIVLVIGTSLMVYPAAGLVDFAPMTAELIVIDPQLSALPSGRKVRLLQCGGSEGMRQLVSAWRS